MRDQVIAVLALATFMFLSAAVTGVWLAVAWVVFRTLAL